MHKLLARQLRKYFGGAERVPVELSGFVAAVEQAYMQSDDDRAMLEHSMDTVSEELVDRFQRLNDALSTSQTAKVELNQAVSLLSATLEATTDGILVLDLTGKTVLMSRKFVELWRIPEAVLASPDEEVRLRFATEQLVDPTQITEGVPELFSDPGAANFDVLLFKDGRQLERSSLPQRIGDEIVGRVFTFRDVTERLQMEEQLRQSLKMEAIGTLAGGIAHDFNNLLTVIRGHAELVKKTLHPSLLEVGDLTQILVAADRAAALTHHLLAFSRKQMLQPVPLDLNVVLSSLAPMLRRLIGEDIEIEVAPARDLFVVTADPGQMEQVLVNLIVNARDAMPRGGRITIGTENVVVSDQERLSGLPFGSYVMLSVSDTGHGIPAAVRDRIFEPFFTTKEVGKGTGLGLSTVFGIVKQSDGYLVLDSEVDQGSTFRIYLPRATHAHVPTPRDVEALPELGGWETILLAEDEAAVRALVRRMLENNGYTVLVARDGSEAIRLAAAHAGAIDLFLTDVIMPGTGGVELARRIREHCPDTPVLYMSGYNDEDIARRGGLGEHSRLLPKPFTAAVLALAVRAALEAKSVVRVG
ncbi:MAG: response regulator [Gemmatimonadaceae bacterium]|nr:response regulator [Gemmatimonadaceae bacterium]